MERKPRKKQRGADKRQAERRQAEKQQTGAPAGEDGLVRVGRRNIIFFGAAMGVILAGFVALALGSKSPFVGTVLAPIFLVGGYLVLVPWALVAREKGAPRAENGPAPIGKRPGG
jgi:hypothetical protein